ncbi:MAG: hypothetical protein H6662_15545 [Ardenticatenaceae bacterium]|nr:hypothetical protein [Anaerolineales bacterium]MCB8923001.1 hypothetical protein [Ardenticatenaceae bacterium]MCB8990266.1 hypothetical protein [Ardenticatenaceae bacterium]
MSAETAVPQWVHDYVKDWRDRLLLTPWKIRLRLQDIIDGDENILAQVHLFQEVQTANITFRGDISPEPSDEWQQTILHELMHVRLAEVSEFVRDDIIPELGPTAERVAQAAFRRALEPAVEGLAHVLWALAQE